MKDLHILEQQEYSVGADLALKNSIQHLDASFLLSKNSMYGFAISHCVLSAEELAKASVLKLKSIDSNIQIPNFNKYFYSHKIKHDSILQLVQATLLLNKSNEEIEKFNQVILVTVLAIAALKLLKLVDGKEKNEQDSISKIESIEVLRLYCTYVGLLDNRNWHSPQQDFHADFCNDIQEITVNILNELNTTLFDGQINNANIEKYVSYLKKNVPFD